MHLNSTRWVGTYRHLLSSQQSGFTLAEVLVSLIIVSILLTAASSVVSTATVVNGKTSLRAEASELAFQKLQDYVNTDFGSIPIGDDVTSYEVEDFSSDPSVQSLANAVAKVYVEPESVVDASTTVVVTNYDETVDADPSFSTGSEITATGTIDPTGVSRREWRLIDNNYFNLVYNYYDSGSSNQELPAIDLGSAQTVDTIRINWYSCYYTSTNFRIEGSNNGSTWTTVSSGLSTTSSVGCSLGNYPEDYAVSGSYRYWRIYNVTGQHPTWIALSEMEAYSAASGDVVEQQGPGGSSPGALDFSSGDIDLTESTGEGQQSIGLRFKDVNVPQGTSIDNAYIQFTADESDSTSVNLLVQGVDTDDAVGWSGTSAVDNAISGGNATTANTAWSPAAWSTGQAGAAQQVSVTAIVQEILSRGGWADGNSMAFGITYVSGSGRRVAEKTPNPQLVIEWSESETVPSGGSYIDADMDGDADNPTLLRVRVVIEYDSYGDRKQEEFETFIRQFGIGS